MLKNLFKKIILRSLGRTRLFFWLAKDATQKEIYSFNIAANTFSKAQEKSLQLNTLANLLKSGNNLSLKYLHNYLENGNNYYSQLGQDCLVDTIFNNKENGFFIEIGVGDGQSLSNSFFLEKNRGWNGILCEPAKQFKESITKTRTAVFSNTPIYSHSNHTVNFSESKNGEFSSIKQRLDENYINNEQQEEYPLKTLSFNDLCRQNNCTKIDYLSVDTEGSEFEILSTINFSEINIGCISVEHNFDYKRYLKIKNLLNSNNFIEIAKDIFVWDSIFVNIDYSYEFDMRLLQS
ncbi:hypothetical protein ASU31_12665 [Pedobacter ginsenosidimutans]|uniref:Methyltransferase FkbM domain-containing protein n=1 Tax=Pedobacter ginsenosidimutans TaxID=687842 RepID=A0A0T5VPN1_9SPHI|nr:FkbM family methyltransferase [Pedobacter ginsenosidimutans]KRT15831.1 hypothetical protein ASU31_12665 [Pedobacter ginsenosidimutans]